MHTRRTVIGQTFAAAALVVPTVQASQACEASGAITRDRYHRYVSLYNELDPGFIQFYSSDVVMETAPPIKGRDAVLNFCREMRHYVVDTIHVECYVADETGSAAQLLSEFRCVRDMPSTALAGMFGRAVRKGQVRRQRGIILYGVDGGKFKWIRAAPPIVVQDWS